ncbi:MAG TPA: 16S rRNA (cytidine(1402)-2'-O)-methyltransferase [candidate division Zixibacteria bacterium]|nr:16S rRNA (cytidine(1402)-2'-O)-methyltransferase [candidate division Zixibacteria bacterium]
MALFLVATPIGNLEDLTHRAERILKESDVVAAEDTRHTGQLLARLGIKARLISFHEQNEEKRVPEILEILKEGKNVALVSDAGTPGVSDPGFVLVRACHQNEISVYAVPGPSAVLAALTTSGLPTNRFLFEGFLPKKPGKRRKRLEALQELDATLIFFESPFRLSRFLEELRAVLGNRRAAVARELTKKFEETKTGDLSTLAEHYSAHPPKGEITVVVEGAKAGADD